MPLLVYSLAMLLTFATVVVAEEKAESALPTWQDMISQGIVPYRQLTVGDFPINDSAHPKHAFHIEAAIQPQYHFMIKPYSGFAYAYVDQWTVFAGLNKDETSRKSAFKTMKAELPYAQALLDINEIHARRLAALKPGELPNARGNTFEEAKSELSRKLKEFVEAHYKASQTEMTAFAKATGNGTNKKKVRDLGAEIKKRLEATPAATVPFTENAVAPGSSPVARPVPTTSVSPAAPAAPASSP